MTLFAGIRAACARVAARARYVRLSGDVGAYAAGVLTEAVRNPVWDTVHHVRGDERTTLAFVLTLDAINFGSGYFPHLLKAPGMSGYYTVASRLKERFETAGPWNAGDLLRLTAPKVAELLRQPPGDPVREELMALFARALNDLGRLLLERYRGSFPGLVEDAAGSAERLVGLLRGMPLFRDVHDYHGLIVPLYKRAQITASDLALAFAGRGFGAFRDLAELTMFADNLVPHVLRLDGLLVFEPELTERIEEGDLLPSGSPAEIEIRAVAVHAVEAMVQALREQGQEITARQLDLGLWHRGQAGRYRSRPRHRTRTAFY